MRISLEGRSFLVTGASGFLGSVIREYLINLGASVVGTVNSQLSVPTRNIVKLDLEDEISIAVIEELGPFDAVIHCAAILPGKRKKTGLLVANQVMTCNMINLTARMEIPHFLNISSCSVYGLQSQPCTERDLPHPADLYALSKISCEYLVNLGAEQFGFIGCNLRISAPYGPKMRASTVVKKFLLQAARGEPLILLGTGERSQDFIYEEDVAIGIALAVSHGARGTYNLTSGQSVSMRVLAEFVLRIFNRDTKNSIQISGVDLQESYRGSFPVDAAIIGFDYCPSVSLAEGLKRTAVAWGLL